MSDLAKISLLLPTRGRRVLAERFLASVADRSVSLADVEVIICVDDDDPESHGLSHPDLKIVELIGRRSSMGEYNSRALAASNGNIIVLANDDMVIQTQGWDMCLREVDASFADGIYLAYGNDLFKGGKLCTFPILSRRCCDLLVEPYPRAYRGAFIDYHLFDVFKRVARLGFDRIRYLDDVVFEHLHYRTGKAEKDATYTARGRFEDDWIFVALAGYRRLQARRVAAALRREPLPELDGATPDVPVPKGPWAALADYTRYFLFDHGLPWRWRVWLWFWFLGRYLAANGWLRPLVK